MMTTQSLRTTLLAVTMSVAAFASSATTSAGASYTEPLDQIVAEAKNTQLEAREISALLKSKSPDLDRVKTKMQTLTTHVGALKQHIAELDAHADALTSRQKQELNRMKQVAELLQVFVDQKQIGLDQAEATRNRNLLRAQAEGIALRAGMVEQSALKIRS